jgi:hypothetical protein
MIVETAAFGLGGTTKTIPEIVEQITQASEYFDLVLGQFIESRMNRDTDKGYYGEEGMDYLKKIVEYQNRINNRIGKLWMVYKKEVKAYHKERRERINSEYPDASSIEPKKENVPHESSNTLLPNHVYIANDDFDAQESTEISLRKGKRYLVLEKKNDSGWILVRDMDTMEENYAPVDFFDLNSESKPIQKKKRQSGKYYHAEVSFQKTENDEIDLVAGKSYYLLNDHGNGWSLLQDPATNETGNAPSDYLSSNEVVQKTFKPGFFYVQNDEHIVSYSHDNIFKDVFGDEIEVNDPSSIGS